MAEFVAWMKCERLDFGKVAILRSFSKLPDGLEVLKAQLVQLTSFLLSCAHTLTSQRVSHSEWNLENEL